ncbi:unnamed protein product [Linum tenue]|uniref:AP2/ERF domain-containing protein n=1 Tax=Linum tenue TaxID=586396 RepID=A0AAV0K0H6_9ROSI|nr:unnamed protein product [Linum tenue]
MARVFNSTQHSQSQPQSSHDSSSSAGSAATSSSGSQQHHQLAAEVETRHPVYRGVRSRKGDKWVCELREPNTGTRVWLGTYPDPEMAARAHDVAALAFRGKSACLNFADSAWRLPIPASTDTDDVRRAAAEAAEMFRPGGGSETEAADEHEHVDNNGGGSNRNDVVFYVEAEEELEMPRLLSEMAEGLLLSPPPCYGDGWSYVEERSGGDNNNIAAEYDWSLWS